MNNNIQSLIKKIKKLSHIFMIIFFSMSFSVFSLSPRTNFNSLPNKTFDDRVLNEKTNYFDSNKYKIKMQMIKALMNNHWRLDITAKKLNTSEKRIKRYVGKSLIEKGRSKERQKAIELEKEMIICALTAYRFNVRQAASALQILHKKIYEVVTKEHIQSGRLKAEEELKKLIINVLEEYNWNIIDALNDRRLIEEEVVQNTIYNLLGTDFIQKHRQTFLLNNNNREKEEIIEAIKLFITERNCLYLAQKYLKLKRGTFNDRMRKYNITLQDFKYSEERVLPVLIEVRGNLTNASKILKIDPSVLQAKFSLQIEIIKQTDEEVTKIFQAGSVIEALNVKNGIKKHAAKYLNIMPMTIDKWIKKYEILEMDDSTKEHYRIRYFFMLIDNIFSDILKKWNSIDKRKYESLKFFFTLNQFKMFRTQKLLEKMLENKSSLFFEEDKQRALYYNDLLIELYHILDQTGKNRNELLEQIKEVEEVIKSHIPENIYHFERIRLNDKFTHSDNKKTSIAV